VAKNEPTQQLAYEDFEQAGRKINFNNKDSARFDRRKARCYNCLQLGHFPRECNVKKVDEKARFESNFAFPADNADGSVNPTAAEFAMMGTSPKAKLEKKEWEVRFIESLARFDKWKESSQNLAKLLYSSMSTRTKLGLGFKKYIGSDEVCDLSTPSVFDSEPENREVKYLYERFVKAVTSPQHQKLMPLHCVSSPKTNDSFSTVDVKILPKSNVKDPSPTNGFPSCSFKENVKPTRNLCNKSGLADRINCKNNFVRSKKCFVCCSKSHLIKDCDLYDNLDNFPSVVSKAAFVPASSRHSLASTSAGSSISTVSRNRLASIHAGRHIPAGRINKPAPFPVGRSVPTGWANPAARPFFGPTNLYFDNVYCPGIYDHMSMNTGRWGSAVHPHVNKDIGIVDSGCSRSMIGNKEKLDDFVQVKGGTVTFGGGDGKITGKGTIRTSKLNFENIYYVKELQNFNLFSVSQICDKKNKVMFTDDECLVLTKEFQLPDESQLVLRIPRRHDLYTFNLSDIQPEQHINCLLAKASLEESIKWHRRMAHMNFKTINKLAKNGMVEGTKDETFYILKDFLALIENQLNKKVKAIRVADQKNRTLIEAARSMLADSKLPTMFWIEAVSTACYVLNRVSITNPQNKTPYELLSGKVPNIRYLKPFGCQVTILNTSDHLGKFEGKANDGFLVGYVAHSYTRFKTNPPAGTHDTNIIAGTQDVDSESECDEHLILVPFFPSNSILGPVVHNVSAPIENNLDYAEELARLQRQEHEAHSAAAKYGFEFSDETAEMLHQAKIKTRRNLVLAAGDPAGSVVSIGGVPAGSIPTSSVPAGSAPAGHIPTSIVPAGSVPASHVPTSSIPAGGVLAGSMDSAGFGDPAASESVLVVFPTDHAATSLLPPGHSLGSSKHSIRFPSTSDLGNHHPMVGIFSSSSYDDDFCADVTNLALTVVMDPIATKRVNTIHPQSQIIRELQTNHADHLHCLFAYFLSQLEPSSVANALADPNWVAAMQEEMQQFYNQHMEITRFVAQGHRQEEGIDYDEIFAPVAKIKAIRLFLAFASYMGFMVYQMDVKSSFLYGEIEEEVYVTQPKGFEDPHHPKHVYRVVKALGTIDKTLFLKKDSRYIIIVQVYVDDIIFGSMNKAWCDEFEVLMKREFEMSDMGELTFFLGLQVKRLPNGIFISQDKYVKDMLKKFDMESVRTATTPYKVPKHKYKDEPDDAVNVHLYRSMIGSLMYLTAFRPDIMFEVSACSKTSGLTNDFSLKCCQEDIQVSQRATKLRKSITGGCQFLGRRLISWQCKKQIVVATSSTEVEYVAAASCCGQSTIFLIKNLVFHQRTKHIEIRHHFIRDANEKNLIQSTLGCSIPRMTTVSCGFLLYAVQIVGRPPLLLVVLVFLLVVLVPADGRVRTGSCTLPIGSYLFMLLGWFLLDDHNKVAYLEKGKGWEAYEQILDFLNRSHIRYALTHRPHIVFDSLVKQFWATATVHNHEAGPSKIIATIDGNEVVVTESLIRTQLQLNDVDGLYEFTLHDVLDGIREIGTYNFSRFILYGMIGNIGSKRHKFLMYPCFLQMILGIQTTDPSPRPTFDFTTKLFSNMKLNWDGPHMPLLAPMLVVPAGGDGADAVATGAAAAHDVPSPPPPPIVPPTHSSSSTPGPSTAAQATPVMEPSSVREPTLVREPTPVKEPTPSPVRQPTPFREPTSDSPRPPSPSPYPRSEEVGPTTSTRPPSPTRQTFFQEDISEGGGDFVSLPKSNEAPQTPAATTAGGAEDSAALTALSFKIDRCINRVTSLENELGVTKKVLGGAVLKLVTRVKRLEGLLQQRKQRLVLSDSEGEEAATKEQDIDLDALHKLASTSLGGDSTVEAAYTIYKASQDAHASSDAGHAAAEVPDDTTMPFRRTSTTRRHLRKPFTSSASEHFQENISTVEDTLPAGEGIPTAGTTIPAASSIDPTVQAIAVAPSSTIPAADKGKAPMVDDSLPADLLSEQERILKNLHDYQLGEELAKKLHAEQEAEFAKQQEELAQKAQAERVASPAEQGTGLSDQRRRELDATQLIYTETDWLELTAKIATNSALSKQLLGDDGWTMKQVKAVSLSQLKHEFEYIQRTLERSNLQNFKRTTFRPAPSLETPSVKRARQEVPQDVHAASLQVPASFHVVPSVVAAVLVPAASSVATDVSVSAVPPDPAVDSAHVDTEEVIEFGDSYKVPTNFDPVDSRTKDGRTVTVTTDDMQKKKNDVKARTTLLLSLPDEHQLRFSKYKTARELWVAILKTFCSNEATKKKKKNLLKQQYGNFKAKGTETLEQTFNR
nr:hypothetical protein [Tanacetum cinerariifolium]